MSSIMNTHIAFELSLSLVDMMAPKRSLHELTDDEVNGVIGGIRADDCVLISCSYAYPVVCRMLRDRRISRAKFNKVVENGQVPDSRRHHVWVLPIHSHDEWHWTLIVVYLRSNSICYFDSLNEDDGMCHMQRVRRFCVASGLLTRGTVPTMETVHIEPPQTDGVSCGYYMLRIAWLHRLCERTRSLYETTKNGRKKICIQAETLSSLLT